MDRFKNADGTPKTCLIYHKYNKKCEILASACFTAYLCIVTAAEPRYI